MLACLGRQYCALVRIIDIFSTYNSDSDRCLALIRCFERFSVPSSATDTCSRRFCLANASRLLSPCPQSFFDLFPVTYALRCDPATYLYVRGFSFFVGPRVYFEHSVSVDLSNLRCQCVRVNVFVTAVGHVVYEIEALPEDPGAF